MIKKKFLSQIVVFILATSRSYADLKQEKIELIEEVNGYFTDLKCLLSQRAFDVEEKIQELPDLISKTLNLFHDSGLDDSSTVNVLNEVLSILHHSLPAEKMAQLCECLERFVPMLLLPNEDFDNCQEQKDGLLKGPRSHKWSCKRDLPLLLDAYPSHCPYCQKVFKNDNRLQSHMKYHRGFGL